jgi:hypothetical protein
MHHCARHACPFRVSQSFAVGMFVAGVLAACGDAATTRTDGDPQTPAPVPAVLAVQAGNDQEALPSTAVGVKPAVVVRDDRGAPLAGISVAFAADSGGGTIQSQSATTGTDGSASPGTWTLGAAEGRNVLIARVGTLPPAKIVALSRVQTVSVNGGTVGPTGGAIVLTLAGSTLNGTRLTFPPDAVTGSSQVSFSVSSATGMTLPVGITALSPALAILGPIGTLRTPALLRLPILPAPGKVRALVAVALNTGQLSVLPSVSQTASYITVGIGSFDGSAYATPVVNAMASNARGFATVSTPKQVIVMAAIDSTLLARDFDSGFRPGVDDWDFPRQAISSFPESLPDGFVDAGRGMVASSLWYFSNARASNGNLYRRFQEASGIHESNRKGMRWVSVTSETVPNLFGPLGLVEEAAKGESGSEKEIADISILQLKAAFLLSGNKPQPVYLFALDGDDANPRLLAAPSISPFPMHPVRRCACHSGPLAGYQPR